MLPEVGGDSVRQRELQQQLNQLLQRIDWLVDALLNLAKIDAGTAYFLRNTLDAAQVLAASGGALGDRAGDPGDHAAGHGLRQLYRRWRLVCRSAGEYPEELYGACAARRQDPGGDLADAPLYAALPTGYRPGFAPDDLPHLFERFYKGHNAAANSFGIGLALAQRIISAQNGTIRAQNAPEGGALFTVRFYHGTI